MGSSPANLKQTSLCVPQSCAIPEQLLSQESDHADRHGWGALSTHSVFAVGSVMHQKAFYFSCREHLLDEK